MENKQHYRDRNAGVGHVKCGPGIGVSNVQIEKEKIDHVPIKQAVGQISEDPCEKKRKRYVAQDVLLPPSCEKAYNYEQRDNRNHNEERIITPERAKCCAGVGNVHQTEKIRHHYARVIWANESQNQLFGPLVQRVERQREKKNEFHVLSAFVSCRAESRHL